MEAAHDQRGFHGLEVHGGGRFGAGALRGKRGLDCGDVPCAADGQVADFKHLLDGGDAGDGVLAELADAVGERAEQAVADVDRAAAHAGDDAGVLRLGAVELGQNHVLAGTAGAAEDAEDLDLHGLGLAAGEDGPGGGRHALAHLAEGEEASGGGRRSGGGRGLRAQGGGWKQKHGHDAQRQHPGRQGGPDFLQASFHVY